MSNEEPHRFAAKFKELEASGVEVVLLEAKGRPELDVLARPPTRAEWRKAKIDADDPKTKADTNANVVRNCVLWPVGDEFRQLAERWPGWVDNISGQLGRLVGTDIEVRARKL